MAEREGEGRKAQEGERGGDESAYDHAVTATNRCFNHLRQQNASMVGVPGAGVPMSAMNGVVAAGLAGLSPVRCLVGLGGCPGSDIMFASA